MKRILILVTSLDRGGIETMIMNYYRVLDREKYQFDFLINRAERGAYEDEIEALGGKVFRMGRIAPWRYFGYRKELLVFLREHPEYKIIHSHLEERSWWGLSIAAKAGVSARIAHMHNVYPVTLNPKSWYRQWLRWRIRLSRQVVTGRLACSQMAGQWLYGRAKFSVLTNAITLEKFEFNRGKRRVIREELGLDEDVVLVGQVGRLVTQKNPMLMPRVIRESGGKYQMIYIGKGELEDQLRREIESLGVEKRVKLLGTSDRVQDYYMAMDVLVVPSMFEGLGMVVVEAGATGLPVIASEHVPNEANVAGNVIQRVALGEIEPWVKALRAVEMISEKERVEKSRDGRKAELERGYDVKHAVKWLEKYYLEAK